MDRFEKVTTRLLPRWRCALMLCCVLLAPPAWANDCPGRFAATFHAVGRVLSFPTRYIHNIYLGSKNAKAIEKAMLAREAKPNLRFLPPEKFEIEIRRNPKAQRKKIPYLPVGEYPAPFTRAREFFPNFAAGRFAKEGEILRDVNGVEWRIVSANAPPAAGVFPTPVGNLRRRLMLAEERGATLVRVDAPAEQMYISQSDFGLTQRRPMVELIVKATNSKGREIRIPTLVSPTLLENDEWEKSLRVALSEIPENTLHTTKKLVFPGEPTAKGFAYDGKKGVAGGAEGRTTTIYGSLDATKIATLKHEHAHNLAQYLWGRHKPFRLWKKAMATDGEFVSEYAEKYGGAEDFAETVKEYLKAAQLPPAEQEKIRAVTPARFAVVDKIFDQELGGPDGAFWRELSAYYGVHPLEHPLRWGLFMGGRAGSTYLVYLYFRDEEESP